MSGWGPQSTGYAPVPPGPASAPPKPGAYWIGLAIAAPAAAIAVCTGVLVAGMSTPGYCARDRYDPGMCATDRALARSWWTVAIAALVAGVLAGLVVGVVEGRRRRQFASGRAVSLVVVVLFFPPMLVGYAAGYGLGRALPPAMRRTAPAPPLGFVPEQRDPAAGIYEVDDPLASLRWWADPAAGCPGGHLGWSDAGIYFGAAPRGAVLVIGPPGSGKTSAVIIPSVIVAPGACVSSSVKSDVMAATWRLRAKQGQVWHFDPGGAVTAEDGVSPCRWSPLVGVSSWDDARRVATRMAEPVRQGEQQHHFVDRARDWLEVLLYAAHLDHRPIGDVADWAASADTEDTSRELLVLLLRAGDDGDQGAVISRRQLEALLGTPDRERGSVLSTLARLLRVYGSTAARAAGDRPNFDPHAFVRSGDTLYLTAAPERQAEYAPILAGLLEELRHATYARHAAEAAGAEPKRSHVTFVLDEANNTAPVPLPAIVSEAGGQSLHLVVGIQDLSRARAQWGREAEGFLTLFTVKLVLRGVVEPFTLDALSSAFGEYDRVMVGYTRSTTYIGPYSMPIPQVNPTTSIQRQRVLHQGDIANLPAGYALMVGGASWQLVRIGMHWQHPVWRYLIRYGKNGLQYARDGAGMDVLAGEPLPL